MSIYGRAAIIAAVTVAGAAMAQDHATPPVAVYWMSAQTTSGMMAMMGAGGGGRPSASAMMAMMRGGMDPNAANHSLKLQLGSTRHAPGEPQAEHDPDDALGAGSVLPLVSPEPVAIQRGPTEQRPEEPQQRQTPKGKILIFWGCGEHAGPGQPEVIDFAKMSQNPAAMGEMMRGMAITPMQPPSASRYATYGEWPNVKSSATIPANGSLVGQHVVKGNYTPEMHFALNPNQDFMAPFQLTTNQRTQSGSVQLAWRSIPTALGYFASVFGAQGGGAQGAGGGDGATMVMWSSSASRTMAFSSPDFLPPAETRRLVADGHLLAPSQQPQCIVPQEVVQAMGRGGMLQMVAYGEEANFAYPPRPNSDKPWHPEWEVKVRYRSSTSAGLGQANPGGGRGGQQQQQQPSHGPGSILKGLGGLGGLIP